MIGSIGVGSGIGAAQAHQPEAAAPAPQPAPVASPAPVAAPAQTTVALDVPADADESTACGREEIQKAYDMRAVEQGSVSADVLAQVAATYATYAASRPAA